MCRWQTLNAKEGSVMRSTVLATPQRISPRQMSLLAAAPLAGILSFPMWLSPSDVVIREFDAADVLQLLTILFLVALLAERALEIFVGTWRGPGATQLELAVSIVEDEIRRLQQLPDPDPRALADARERLEEAKRQERQYRCVTRQVVLRIGLGLGLLVSAVGCRALEVLLGPSPVGWSVAQGVAFRLVDVVLTGGVIAGGSEGIHRIATVFDNFMSATAKRAKGNA
jgi:hypothetical protein